MRLQLPSNREGREKGCYLPTYREGGERDKRTGGKEPERGERERKTEKTREEEGEEGEDSI
jgi:hypothetical protein